MNELNLNNLTIKELRINFECGQVPPHLYHYFIEVLFFKLRIQDSEIEKLMDNYERQINCLTYDLENMK